MSQIAMFCAQIACIVVIPLAMGVIGAQWAARSVPDHGPSGGHTVTLPREALANVLAAADRVDERAARIEDMVDVIAGGDPVARARTDSLRCALLHLAVTLGKRKLLSSGRHGSRLAPSAANWAGWTQEELESCEVCRERLECSAAPRDGGRP